MALALAVLVILAVVAGLAWLARELRVSQETLGASLSELQRRDRPPARAA